MPTQEPHLSRENALASEVNILVHDLNNVLTGIAGSISTVMDDLQPGAAASVPLSDALAGVYRAAALLRRLSEAGAPGESSFALAPLVAETARLAQSCRAASALELPVISHAARVSGDGTEFQRALLNVLLNALEVNPPGRRVQLTYRYERAMHVLEVRDEGPGIPAALRERVFEPYFTTRVSGTGLGLASARAAMLALGGELDLVASSPSGTVFAVRVPAEVMQ
ncbi:MAG TPA: sensor histidine kinase [Tepidiformaceae bacterium]|nr:sensor histidine kinase [Tepidiformaceae bacterium]